MKIVFILPVTSQARYHKRIDILEKLGVTPKVLAFERGYYPGKPFKDGYVPLGRLDHGSYHKRLFPFAKALPIVRSALKDADALYAFGVDMFLLGWLAGWNLNRSQRMVLEVADIRRVFLKSGPVSSSLRRLERFLLSSTDVLVTTSEHYVSGYYRGVLGVADMRCHVIENKLDGSVMQPARSSTHKQGSCTLRLGYFGLLRSKHTWEILKKIAERGKGRSKVYVRGIATGFGGFEEEARRVPNLSYEGPYVSPDDLSDMYGQIDLTWIGAIAPVGSGLMRNDAAWSRGNRFYEGCFFRKPMIAQVGTADGETVEAMNLGPCIDIEDPDGTVDRILGIDESELAEWRESLSRVSESMYLYTDEHKRLLDSLIL